MFDQLSICLDDEYVPFFYSIVELKLSVIWGYFINGICNLMVLFEKRDFNMMLYVYYLILFYLQNLSENRGKNE